LFDQWSGQNVKSLTREAVPQVHAPSIPRSENRPG
jgi:hypothetical protein